MIIQKKLLLLSVILIFGHIAYSQDLRIQYDHATGKTVYKEIKPNGDTNNKELKKPFARRNKKIIVEVLNVNPFAYKITHQIAQNNITNQFDSTSQLIPSFSRMLTQFQTFGYTHLDTSGTRGARNSANLYTRLQAAVDSLKQIDMELAGYIDTYGELKTFVVSGELSKQTIMSRVDSAIRDAFGLDPADRINTNALVRAVQQRMLNNYRAAKLYYSSLKPFIDTTRDKVFANEVNLANTYVDSLRNYYQDGSFFAKISNIGQLLQVVKNARFNYVFEDIADKETADITLTITNRQARFDTDTVPDIQNNIAVVKKYRVIIKGENVVRSSIGISFPTLLGKAVRYGVEDLKIVEKDDDRFIPNLTTFINFHPFRGTMSNTGGVLGFGYPLTGKDKDLNIMTGISQSTGDRNSVVFSAGLVFGQTNRLQTGTKIGDTVSDANIAVPTEKSWKLGLFAGIAISFFNR